MEPFSALAVATSAVQFIDFTSKILSQSHKLRASATGQSEDHDILEDVTTNLRNISAKLSSSATSFHGASAQSQDDKDLEELCQSCHAISIQLLESLERLKVKNGSSQWDSFRQALRTVWSREELDALEKRLDRYRQQLVLCILVSLRKSTPNLESHHQYLKKQVTDMQQNTESLRSLILTQTSDTARWQSDLLQAIKASHATDSTHTSINAHSNLLKSDQDSTASEFRRIILQKLRFREMDHRFEHIKEAHKHTFEWIWQDPEDEDHRWQNFSNFLQDDTNLFWVTGRPGAGKSTLMKYLSADPRIRQLLSSWTVSGSDTTELVCAEFFFWNSGTPIQMSREALLRTLIYNVLESNEDCLSVIFPDLWEAYYLVRAIPLDDWVWYELTSAFNRLVNIPGKRFFFLIDGLDEFSNDESKLLELVDFLKSLVQQDNVKICVSSRPWNIFKDAFKSDPSLRIEDLTFKDIADYVQDRLLGNPGYNDLAIDEPAYTSSLVQSITEKSNGVFLWVNLVVTSLLSGITDGDRKENLDARLAALPSDLEEFFAKMLKGENALYNRQACQIFRLFSCWNDVEAEEMQLLTMYMANMQGMEEALKAPIKHLTPEEEASKLERMNRRLNSRCKGLLESQDVGYDRHISWIHRTAADYVTREDTWDWILETAGDTFDPFLDLSASICHILKRKPSEMRILRTLIRNTISFSKRSLLTSDGATSKPLVKILDEIDHTIRQLRDASPGNSETNISSCYCYQGEDRLNENYPISFFNIAVFYDLHWYIDEKIAQSQLRTLPKSAAPLLFCALNLCGLGGFGAPPGSDTLMMCKTLLEGGVYYNPTFKGCSLLASVKPRVNEELRGGYHKEWREVQKLLLQYRPAQESKREAFQKILDGILGLKDKMRRR